MLINNTEPRKLEIYKKSEPTENSTEIIFNLVEDYLIRTGGVVFSLKSLNDVKKDEKCYFDKGECGEDKENTILKKLFTGLIPGENYTIIAYTFAKENNDIKSDNIEDGFQTGIKNINHYSDIYVNYTNIILNSIRFT
jgi:hypothetical protein